MSLHLIPADQAHQPSLDCPCRPAMKQVRHGGAQRPAVVHRDITTIETAR